MTCPICLNQVITQCIIPCGHCLCHICINKVNICPICRGEIIKTQRIFVENQYSNTENNFVNLSFTNFEFLKEASPLQSNNQTDIGLALSPLFKAHKYNATCNELKIIMKFFVPSINLTPDVVLIIELFPLEFRDYFKKSMNYRYQMVKHYGNNFFVKMLDKTELNKISNKKINQWLEKYSFLSYPGEATLPLKVLLKPKLDIKEHILNRQLEILNSNSGITIKRMALLTMRHLYKLDINGDIDNLSITSSTSQDLDSEDEIHSTISLILETALNDIFDE